MNVNVKSVVVLTAICLIVAVLLSVTNFYTAPVIEDNKQKAIQESLAVVMPDSPGFTSVDLSLGNFPKTVTGVYTSNDGKGYAVTCETKSQYSSGNMAVTVGINFDGTIGGISLTGYYESKDFGSDYPDTYIGSSIDTVSDVDIVSGVTYSSNAFKGAVSDALLAVDELKSFIN